MKKIIKDVYMVSCTAKHTIYRIAVCLLAVLVFGGCVNQGADDTATITIHLSMGAGRAIFPPDEETWSRLLFIVEFSGPSIVTVGPTAPGTRTINVSVVPGHYVITATALLDGEVYEVYAKGSTPAQALAGQLTSVPLSLYYAGNVFSIINIAGIGGVTTPVTGGIPVAGITGNDQYSGTVDWSPNHSTFAAATRYTATITLTAKEGYTLQGVAANFFTVAGAASVSNAADSGVVTVVFPSTAGTAANPAKIDIAAIKGVTVPVTGGIPVTSITGTAQYTGTVTWEPNHTVFAPNTAYTATIKLTAKTNYTLQGVAENFFTVDGAEAGNSANSDVVTAVFPQTYIDTTINAAAINGIASVTGKSPIISIITDQYTGIIAWLPSSQTFASATQYTATIFIEPKEGYTLQGVTANLFTVEGASSVGNNANSGVITAVFPKTHTTIGMANITGVTVPRVGDNPVTSIDNLQYTGSILWKTADGVAHTGVFANFNIYTATITLTPKTGYTFAGVAANFFTVAGATTNNPPNSGVVTATFPQIPFSLGGAGPGGGKVFYYNAEGFTVEGYGNPEDDGYFTTYTAHYLEAAPVGSGQLAWASSGFLTTNILGTASALGTGRKNTALILATDANAPAAKACKVLTTGGKTDWFLPSSDELDLLYNNRFHVGNLGNANYYCSTQSGASSVAFLIFQLEDLWRSANKSDTNYVRAIRAF
jgi:hypothetical protein